MDSGACVCGRVGCVFSTRRKANRSARDAGVGCGADGACGDADVHHNISTVSAVSTVSDRIIIRHREMYAVGTLGSVSIYGLAWTSVYAHGA